MSDFASFGHVYGDRVLTFDRQFECCGESVWWYQGVRVWEGVGSGCGGGRVSGHEDRNIDVGWTLLAATDLNFKVKVETARYHQSNNLISELAANI